MATAGIAEHGCKADRLETKYVIDRGQIFLAERLWWLADNIAKVRVFTVRRNVSAVYVVFSVFPSVCPSVSSQFSCFVSVATCTFDVAQM